MSRDPYTGFDDLKKLPIEIASNMSIKDLILHTFPNIETRYFCYINFHYFSKLNITLELFLTNY